MATQHTLPVPPDLLARARERVSAACGRLLSSHDGIAIDDGILAAAMEELNAEPNRTLALKARAGKDGKVTVDGLDRHLAARGFPGAGTADEIARVLAGAGITGNVSVADRRSRRFVKGVRLLHNWTWTVGDCRVGRQSAMVPQSPAGEKPAWTDVCPVCRNGRLEPTESQRLFGVHATEFLACAYCGARFVPDAGRFRLVAIVRDRDPDRARLLNRTFAPDEWQASGRGGEGPDRPGREMRRQTVAGPNAHAARGREEAGTRVAVDARGRTFWFSLLPLQFGRGTISDLFSERRDTLRELLGLPEYRDVAEPFRTRYRGYLDTPAGFFLSELKNRRDPAFLQILNPCGDSVFCSFRAAESDPAGKRGVYIIIRDGAVAASGACLRPFREMVDQKFGSLEPASCYRDGDVEACRINALVCGNRKAGGGIYVYTAGTDEEILALARVVAKEKE